MILTLLVLAFASGVLSFLSPCIIPMLGVYFSLITGLTVSELKNATFNSILQHRIMKNTFAFVTGFAVVFIAAGALAGEFAFWLNRWQWLLSILGGSIVFILALKMLGLFDLAFLSRFHWEPALFEKIRINSTRSAGDSFVVGLLFAIACSHCIAPTLLTILALAGATQSPLSGMVVMFFFSVGLALPYTLAGLSFAKVIKNLKRFRTKQKIAERLAGLLMLYLAYILYTDQLTEVTGFLARFMPRLPLGM